ncbi:MAG: protein TolR [Proteobacteria bacterium]|jgi:biopolymer transport protein TolR|nr:protein TolR [Pseudomonadota bacterium]MDA1136095.1 protein TolR [Pseudomonadota bacterium]|tara:strand:+ start:12 stop:437 length:426 start_codon:yes stop_codon:yes gene_type:complete
MYNNFALRSSRKKKRSISQINVTPFVDVMLVLLIVFMITAPLLTVGVSVDLPKTKASELNSKGDPIVISIKQNGDLYIQERIIDNLQLLPRLQAISSGNKDLRVYVRGDKDVPYGIVLDTIAKIKKSGFKKVALVAKLKES